MPLYKFNVSGGGLPSTYTAVQVHFHWGNNNDEGSEHTMDGKFFPAEVRNKLNGLFSLPPHTLDSV